MRPLRRAPSPCDITLLTDFSVRTWDILQEKRKKKTTKNIRTANITISAVLLVRLLLNVQQHFSHIYSFHWLELGQRVTITTGQRRRSGWGGPNICFAAFFALFHGLLCRFSDMKRFLNGDGRERRGRLRRSADPERRKRSSRRTAEPRRVPLGSNPSSYFLKWPINSLLFFL